MTSLEGLVNDKGTKVMDLINRYIYAVTQKLPESQRADIEKESRTRHMLEDRGVGVESASLEEVEQVLLELGAAREMQRRYRGRERYLIGPGLINSYWVQRIVLYSIVVALGIVYIIIDLYKHGTHCREA